MHLPFDDNIFDVLYCGETFGLLESPDPAMFELFRVVKPRGFVCVSMPYRDRNRAPEHVWEYEPSDIMAWAAMYGELSFFDTLLGPKLDFHVCHH